MKKINNVLRTWCLVGGLMVIGIVPAAAQQISPAAYIQQYKDMAINSMRTHGLPASIILAIAMHESAYGNSRIAHHLNNHFGIKGPNNSKVIRSAYKGYDSVEESYQDFIDFLKRRESTQELFEEHESHEYREWVRGIARSGYAQSPSWSAKVLGMIQKYNLDAFDRVDGAEAETTDADLSSEPEIYVVKKGDTLSAIARRHGTTVKALQLNNGLSNSRLQIGQQLFL